MNTLERFEAKYIPEPNSGCWLWIAGCDAFRYGRFWTGERGVRAYQWAYWHYVGPVPEGKELDHLCRVKQCVNPDHLEAVSHRENSLRGISFSALNAKKTHCKHGHPFSGDNLRVDPQRGHVKRTCKMCQSRRKRLAKQALKSAKSC